jgi:hypothetical protein
MPRNSVDRLLTYLEESKRQFSPRDRGRTLSLLQDLARRRFPDAPSLIRFHESVLFLRAYPASQEILQRADEILGSFAQRVAELRSTGADLSPFEEPEVSGIAGTSFSAVFSYAVARFLAGRHRRQVRIDWDYYDKQDNMGPTLPRFLPLLEEDSLVEAHVPFRDWMSAAKGDLAWLVERFASLPLSPREQAELYDSLKLLICWELGDSTATRSRMRLPAPKVFYHEGPLLRRKDISLVQELASPPLRLIRLSRAQGEKILTVARDTSAARYRELHGFTYGDPARVVKADAGRGVEIYLWGVPPEYRLPLRAYHGAMFFKNGVPVGYVEGLSLFERMEVGFNLYYTFREGESAWLFARTLRLFRQLLGVTCFSLDPYQIGFENDEAIESGAFWFYRKLGFRPVMPEPARVMGAEEKKVQKKPDYRTPPKVLRRLAEGPMIFEVPSMARGEWDRFQVRNLGLAVQRRMAKDFGGKSEEMRKASAESVARALGAEIGGWNAAQRKCFENVELVLGLIPDLARWTDPEKQAAVGVINAKAGRDEAGYLRRLQKHARLRAAFLKFGSAG